MTRLSTRADWGHPTPDDPGGYQIGQVGEVIVHHSYRPHLPAGASLDDARSAVYGIWDYHVNTNGWQDIGYQWLVDQDGRIFEGRGWWRTGAHTEGRNSTSAAVCFLIDGDQHEPTDDAWAAARRVVADGIDRGALTAGPDVSGHTDYAAKTCPGTATYPHIGRLTAPDIGDIVSEAEHDPLVRKRVNEITRLGEVAAAGAVAQMRSELGLPPDPASDLYWVGHLRDGTEGIDWEHIYQRLAEKAG